MNLIDLARQVQARLLASLAVAAITLAALVAAAPDIGDLAPVASDRIAVVEPGALDIPRNPDTASRRISHARQLDWGAEGARQYHFMLPIDLPRTVDYAVFAPLLGGTSRLFVNGVPGEWSKNNAYHGPGFGAAHLLGPVPAGYLKNGFNRVDLVMKHDAHHAGARLIYFGESETLLRASATLSAWAASTHDLLRAAALLGLACSLLGLIAIREFPLYSGGLLLVLAAAPFFTPQPLERLVVTVAVTGTVLCLWPGTSPGRIVLQVFRGFAVVAVIATLLRCLLAYSSVSIPQPLLVVHIANLGLVPLVGIGLPLLLVSDVQAFISRLRRISQEQAVLIETKEDRLRTEIRVRAVLEERQRFTRDVHDGIGGHMQSLLMRMRMGKIPMEQVESEISRGIADLRLMVDSLDHVGNDLGAALSTFQTRAAKQMEAAGIDFTWRQDANLSDVQLPPQGILSLYRSMQEALTNCVRHSSATRVSIALGKTADGEQLRIEIEDNGGGMTQDMPAVGRGIRSMRERATLLGGVLTIGQPAAGSGTRIEIRIPAAAAPL